MKCTFCGSPNVTFSYVGPGTGVRKFQCHTCQKSWIA